MQHACTAIKERGCGPTAVFRSEEEKQQFYLSNWIIASAIVVVGAAIVFFAVATDNDAVSMVVVTAADIDIVVIDAAVGIGAVEITPSSSRSHCSM